MVFALGSLVRVLSLNRTGEIVECARSGRYRVRVGGVLLWCREDGLAKADEPSRAKRRPTTGRTTGGHHAVTAAPGFGGAGETRASLDTLDLHGLTVEEALREVEQRLDAALRAGLDRLDIIHGRGSGRIKAAVHKFLKEVSAVRHFAIAPDNPGVTRVRF